MTERWKPTRAGILNVWRYFDEVFTFHDGRLLLRGPNGSGKSKALELLLPFLFDANLQASRLSTFGQGARSMHWNLMGQGAAGSTRVGFVWLELAQGDDEDAPHVTIGARLQASRSETRPKVDYFLADGRVGLDIELTEDQIPRTVAALREHLVGRGTVFATAGEYRTAVRQTLFPTMTPDRYDTLVQALLQLRRPKLSEHLDPGALSSILSSALPPVDAGQIQELAEGFERLDQQRAHLTGLDAEVTAARALLEQARTYGRVVLRDRARSVIAATTRFDATSRDLRLGAERLVVAREEAATARTAHEEAGRRLEAIVGDRETLARSEDYRSGEQLEELRRRVAEAERLAGQIAADRVAEADRAERSARDAREREAEAEVALAERTRRDDALRPLASQLALDHLLDVLDDLRGHVSVRQDQVSDVLRLVGVHEEAVADRLRIEERLSAAVDDVAAASRTLDEAQRALELATIEYADAIVAWSLACRELAPEPEDVRVAIRDERVPAYVESLLRDHVAGLAAAGALLSSRRDAAAAQRDALVGAHAALQTAGPVSPPAPRFRTARRESVPGAALWQVVDFRDGLPEDERAALEAALEASGLLDAWISPSGAVQVDGHDVLVRADAAVDGPSLADVLTVDAAAAECGPGRDVVARVLAAIALGEDGRSSSSVSLDGRWRLGVATGSWLKPEAQFVGAAARERNRRARLADLQAQIEAAEREVADLVGTLADVEARGDAARREAEVLPSDRAVRERHRAVDSTHTIRAERERAATAVQAELGSAQSRVTSTAEELALGADRVSLPTARRELEAVRVLLTQTTHAADSLALADREATAAVARASAQRGHAETDAARVAELTARADDARAQATALGDRLAALQEHLGGTYERAAARMREIETAITTLRGELPRREQTHRSAATAIATLEERSASAERAHDDAKVSRLRVSEDLMAVLRTTLARDADVAVDLAAEDRVRAVLEAARRIDRDVPGRGQETPVSAQNRLAQRFYDDGPRLASRALLELAEAEGFVVPTATTAGRRIGMRELLETVNAERARADAEITEAERSLFEQALTGDTRRHLSATIRDAHELVDRMNDRLATVRTASDVRVRLRWEVRDEEGGTLRQAQALLLKDPARLVEEERAALHSFFRARIDQTHADDVGGSWAQQLAAVFDYTAWHQFRVEMNRGDAQGWRPLTRQAHSVLSGGEKAIALHLPLFAALAAHYEATPLAPRLILLDEVFVGIDSANRGQIFALLGELDLDLVLTSDHEWATYPEVVGIAIHALAAGTDDDEAVTTTRFVWTGHVLVEDPEDVLFA